MRPETLLRLSPATRVRTSRGPEPETLVHAPHTDALITLPASWATVLDGAAHTLGEVIGQMPDRAAALAGVLRLAALSAIDLTPARPESRRQTLATWYVSHDLHVADPQADGGCILVSNETSARVRTSAAGRALWLLARRGATGTELAARTRLPTAALERLLDDLVERRILARAQVEPQLVDAPEMSTSPALHAV